MWADDSPAAVTAPSCRVSRSSSSARTRASASAGGAPRSSSASARGPYTATPAACVATAPTPAFVHGTTVPTAKYFDCTAHPTSPASGSAAAIENVDFTCARTGPILRSARRLVVTRSPVSRNRTSTVPIRPRASTTQRRPFSPARRGLFPQAYT